MSWTPIRDAAAPVLERLVQGFDEEVQIAILEIDAAIAALELDPLATWPLNSLRNSRNILAEHFARLQRAPSAQQENP